MLVLVLIATMLSVTFATRGAMATNRPVIEVLHFIGAKDGFIARHFQRHFLLLGLKGGADRRRLRHARCSRWPSSPTAGCPAARGRRAVRGPVRHLFDRRLGLCGGAGQVVLIAAVTALTSRATVNRTLETIQ